MSNSFTGLFGIPTKKTVDAVMSAFTKTVADLDEVRQDNLATANAEKEIIDAAEQRRQAALEEADRAQNVSHKLKLLLG